MNDGLPPLPKAVAPMYTATAMLDYARKAVERERERWASGTQTRIPTAAMEAEIQAHVRRAIQKERERRQAAEALLRRYRAETPSGHSPHMICSEVDDHFARYKD